MKQNPPKNYLKRLREEGAIKKLEDAWRYWFGRGYRTKDGKWKMRL